MAVQLLEALAPPSLKQLSQQLGMLIKITRTIDRNREDESHGADGEILYVFDTNVVQMFLEPFKNPHFAETFFSPVWKDLKQRGLDRADEEINAQACLLAAEYLMSGRLPGQAHTHGHWYMTPAHETELHKQMEFLVERTRDNVARLTRDNKYANFVLGRAAELDALLNLKPTKDRDEFIEIAKSQGLGDRLIKQIAALDMDSFKDRAEGIRFHEICRLMATDALTQPAKQLARFRSSRILGKMRPLETRLSPSPEDWKEIRTDSLEWRTVMATILQRQTGRTKTAAALEADCDALAMVAWANRHWAKPHQRVLFVTGDRVLLEACRQRYVDDPRQRFFVRSIAQFAPLFNPTSAKSQVERAQAFARLREVLESAMVALNLGLLATRNAEQRANARDGFALLVDQAPESVERILRSFFPRTLDPDWLREQHQALDKLVTDLRSLELLMLEAYPGLVAQRLAHEAAEQAPKSGSQALADAVGSLLDSAQAGSGRVLAYMMPAAVEDLLALIEGADTVSQRVSIQIRLPLLESNQFIDFRETIAWLKRLPQAELEETLHRISERPETIFALAALLAFSLEIWKEAARYADLAARASDETSRTKSKKSRDLSTDRHEVLFLRAIALRFRLFSDYPTIFTDKNSDWQDWHEQAVTVLDICSAYHSANNQWARALRAVSERAALNLAISEMILFHTALNAVDSPEWMARAIHGLRAGVWDLAECDKLAARKTSHDAATQPSAAKASIAVKAAAERQYLHNVYAARAVAMVLAKAQPERREELDELLAALPTRPAPDWPNKPLVALAYQFAATENWPELLKIDENDISLPLDRVAIRALKTLAV